MTVRLNYKLNRTIHLVSFCAIVCFHHTIPSIHLSILLYSELKKFIIIINRVGNAFFLVLSSLNEREQGEEDQGVDDDDDDDDDCGHEIEFQFNRSLSCVVTVFLFYIVCIDVLYCMYMYVLQAKPLTIKFHSFSPSSSFFY